MIKYLMVACTLLACSDISKKENSPGSKFSTEILDTIKTRPANLDAKPLLFEAAFIEGTKQTKAKSVFNLYGVTIGKIKIVSGRIVACDPLHIDEYGIPFTQLFPTGEFPVQLSIAQLGAEEVIAFARINFSENPVAKWKFALQEGQEPIPLGSKKMHGFSVDGSMGIFIDEVACKVLDKDGLAQLDAALYKEMDKHQHNDWRYCMYNFGQHNLVCFSTGFGDGYYPTYIGFDANGKPCRLLTDLRVFDWK